MAVKLRLMRMGKKKQPTYRVVAADSRKARNGRIIEAVGFYDPRRDPSVIEIDNEKAVGWLRNGAQPTERVEKLLKITGAWDEFKGQAAGTSVTAAPEPKAEAVSAPVEEAPVEEASVEEAPVEEASVEEAPVEEASVEDAPVEEAPVEEAPVEEAPVEDAPVEEAPVEEASAEEAPVEEAPV
ncbi:MAG: 30S ribosomal protein S16, partial [Acidimicrobiaceae bacterium]|nr:30S ribosomal protein S16 [Acidimicrobiaceae bacterium]